MDNKPDKSYLRRLMARNCANKPYTVSGQHRLFGSGVLVWCYDAEDANAVKAFLDKFKGFKKLRVTEGNQMFLPF